MRTRVWLPIDWVLVSKLHDHAVNSSSARLRGRDRKICISALMRKNNEYVREPAILRAL